MNGRPPFPEPVLRRIREIGDLCILAGATAEETIEAINVEARKHGVEYRMPVKQQ